MILRGFIVNLSQRLSKSFYQVVAAINEPHNVYLVQHRDSGRFYVKKVLDVYSADVYKDLKAHPIPGIPRIIDSWEEDGRLVIIEEFISGVTLRDLIERTSSLTISQGGYEQAPGEYSAAAHADSTRNEYITAVAPAGMDPCELLTVERIGHYMAGLCEILERLHSHNPPLIHRDLKPSNIIITSCGNAMLLDFNAARFYSGEPGRESDTRLLGTKGYAAPEQYGFGESSPQTDIYSVGRILQECVDALPEGDISSEETAVRKRPVSAKVTGPHVFDTVIRKCTQISPSKRYSSAAALKSALLGCIGESIRPDITGPVINPYLPPGFRTLNPWKMLIASVVYFLVFDLSLTLKDQTASMQVLWMERILVLFLGLMNIALGSNYLGIQRFMPFHDSSSRALRITGVILTMAVVTFIIFMTMIFIIGTAFS